MLFSLTEKPTDPLTAPFVFDPVDACHHLTEDGGYIHADLLHTRGGWAWGASHKFVRPDVPEEIEWAEERTDGSADTKAEALAAAVAWMRSRLAVSKAPTGEVSGG